MGQKGRGQFRSVVLFWCFLLPLWQFKMTRRGYEGKGGRFSTPHMWLSEQMLLLECLISALFSDSRGWRTNPWLSQVQIQCASLKDTNTLANMLGSCLPFPCLKWDWCPLPAAFGERSGETGWFWGRQPLPFTLCTDLNQVARGDILQRILCFSKLMMQRLVSEWKGCFFQTLSRYCQLPHSCFIQGDLPVDTV